LIVSVPLTQTGAVHLDEEGKAVALFGVIFSASALAKSRGARTLPLPVDLLAADATRLPRASWYPLVALGAGSDTPPPGQVGYYSDGAEHAAAVILSASGRRLFIELEGDDVLRTNVAGYLSGTSD
jgi:hypothetical protein